MNLPPPFLKEHLVTAEVALIDVTERAISLIANIPSEVMRAQATETLAWMTYSISVSFKIEELPEVETPEQAIRFHFDKLLELVKGRREANQTIIKALNARNN